MAEARIRVLHIDDDRDHHELVKAQLGRLDADIALERAGSRRAALAALAEHVYDCILTDEGLPEEAGLGLLRELRRKGNIIPFVVLAETDGGDEGPVQTGAVPGDELHALVDHFHFDLAAYWIRRLDDRYRRLLGSEELKAEFFQSTPQKIEELRRAAAGLTAREKQILDLIGAGRSNRDIANELFISYKTAKNHVSHIFAKLGIHTRAEAIHLVMAMKIMGGAG